MATSGNREVASLVPRKYDVSNAISLLDVNRAPLLAILTNAGKDPVSKKGKAIRKKVTTDPEFKWYEDEFGARTATTASGNTSKNIASAPSVAVTTGHGARFSVNDVVKFPVSGYTFLVTAISTDTLTLSNELGGATGTVDLSALDLWIIGNANEEGAGLRTLKGTDSVEKVGYCQIFRTPFGVTGTAEQTDTWIAENDLPYQRRKKGVEHALDIERAFWFSKKNKVTGAIGGKQQRFTEGILNRISTYASSNVDTEAEFETFLESAFAHGNTEKYAFCGPAFVSTLNLWAKNKLTYVDKVESYGVTIARYVSPHGVLNIIKHDMLTGARFGKYCVVLDIETLTYRFLKNRDTKLRTNLQTPGDDVVTEEYLTEAGLQMEQESRSAVCSLGTV